MAVPYLRIFGAKETIVNFERGRRLARDMRPPLNKVADDIMRVIRATFMSQGRRYGGSWEFLDKETVQRKAAAGQDPRILIATEKLMNSWTQRGGDQHLKITGDYIALESQVPYADVHQFGDEDKGIPARPYINFDPRDIHRWTSILERDLMRAMGYRV